MTTSKKNDVLTEPQGQATTTRHENARHRDGVAAVRDQAAAEQIEEILRLAGGLDRADPRVNRVIDALEKLRADLASDREQAAGGREAAAVDREDYLVELDRAHSDDLTGVYRRGMGRIALVHEIERANRSQGALVLAYVDFDRLKDLNDRDGHAAGDAVLRDLVAAMRGKLRSYDPIVRWGGDEFICTISDVDLEGARRRMEEIGEALREVHPGSSVSAGLATLGEGDTLETLIERADAALLEARPAR
jgi:diguanylate cyclase (GGDEF)-like protein